MLNVLNIGFYKVYVGSNYIIRTNTRLELNFKIQNNHESCGKLGQQGWLVSYVFDVFLHGFHG